jgi:aminoglycoside 2''-phosphotransferase
MMKQQELYLKTIRDKYPDFSVDPVISNKHGQNNDILIANNEFIFRFPKYLDGIKQLEIEVAVLSGIQGYITLPIPHITFQNVVMEVGQAFIGYRMISGEPLRRETFLEIYNEKTIDNLAQQLGGFLKELHTVPVQTAIKCSLTLSDTYNEWADIYGRIREKCFPYMRPSARKWASDHVETFLNDLHSFQYEPVLKHGDFGTTNILFDRERRVINGIIDFGGAGLGDPAYDFAGILSSYGESFLQRFAVTYPEIESFWNRILFYKGTFALLEALFGVENDDREAFESGIADYV